MIVATPESLRETRRTEGRQVHTLQRAEQVRQYTIQPRSSDGWIVTLKEDRTLTRRVCYRDWHRVERTPAMFRLEVARLVAHGWEVRPSPSDSASITPI